MTGHYKYDDYVGEFRRRAGELWEAVVEFANGSGPPPRRPYQVEIHPHLEGAEVCGWKCVDCHGRFQRQRPGLPLELWEQLVLDLQDMQVTSVVISGNYSDPTTDEQLLLRLLEIGKRYWGVKLHTYGSGLTWRLRTAILAAAIADPRCDSYLTISRHTDDPGVFREMCRPLGDHLAAFRQERENIEAMFVESHNSALKVMLNCRVTQLNASSLWRLLVWLKTVSPNVPIRFTTDYEPAHAPSAYLERFYREIFMPYPEAAAAVEQAVAISGIDPLRASLRPVDVNQGECWPNDRCYSSLLFSAVGASGHVFMCQGLASRVNQQMVIGDLRAERFPDIWSRYLQDWGRVDCCRCAGECERRINAAIQAEVGGESPRQPCSITSDLNANLPNGSAPTPAG